MGGEKKLKYGKINLEVGSPPRGRGKGITARPKGLSGRITPAWAGKRLSILGLSKGGEDHPRVGGEKGESQTTALSREGSPPRGRGKDAMTMLEILLKRITPAWAGKSCFSYSLESSVWDHPRVGGEKRTGQAETRPGGGSPPRGRGKDEAVDRIDRQNRITPAWAGKRNSINISPQWN